MNDNNESPRVYMYSRVDGNSTFGHRDDCDPTEIMRQVNSMLLELDDLQYKVIADAREVWDDEMTECMLDHLLSEAAGGNFDMLYIASADRLSSDPDKCLSIVEKFDKYGIEVLSLAEGCINIPDEPGQLSKLQIAQLKNQADRIARDDMPYATMDEVFDNTEEAAQKDQNRNRRRRKTQLKLMQRKRLMGQLGLQGGCVYDKHRDKIQRSCGYMRSGNVSHFVSTHPRRKTRSRDRYGSVYTPPKRDIVRIDRMNENGDSAE